MVLEKTSQNGSKKEIEQKDNPSENNKEKVDSSTNA